MTGERKFYGEYLMNAQGEDPEVAGFSFNSEANLYNDAIGRDFTRT